MNTIDWKALKPHVPLAPLDPSYAVRANSAADEMSRWLLADRSPLLLGGPAGVGKSTELARAVELLHGYRVVCLVQLDRFENMRQLSPDRMRLRLLQALGHVARTRLSLQLAPSLQAGLEKVRRDLEGLAVTHDISLSVLLNVALKEIARAAGLGRVALLIDGLEKTPEGSQSRELFDVLTRLPEEVDMAVVIPWHAAFGPHSEQVVREGERFIAVRAVEVDPSQPDENRAFLRRMFELRTASGNHATGAPGTVVGAGEQIYGEGAHALHNREILDAAAHWSGGLPRLFLQLMADAGAYARVRGSGPWPVMHDMLDAVKDQSESFERLLLPGDVLAIRAVVGTRGLELGLDRKIRLMAHGVLLERVRGGERVLEVHPLLRTTVLG